MSDPTGPPAPFPDERVAGSLRLLLDAPGSVPVRVLTAPAGLDVPVRGTVVHDPNEPLPAAPAALLLLVGGEVADPRAREAVRRAAGRRFAAVVVKCRGQDPARLVDEADRCGIAVLRADDGVPWQQIDAALSCALAAYGVGGAAVSAPVGGEQLFALADNLAAVVGGSVAVEDLDQHVVAYSNVPGQRIDTLREQGILQRRVPDQPEQRRQYREVLAASGVVRFPAQGEELARAAVAVRAGTLPLGTLWAIEPEDGLSPRAVASLADGARLAAPHLLRALNVQEAEQRLRQDTLRSLLEGYGPGADEAGSVLGLEPGTAVCLAGFTPGPDTGAAAHALVPHLESALVRHCAAHRPEATVAATSGAVYALVPGGTAAVRRFADGALTALRSSVGGPLRAAVTRPHTDLLRPAALRAEADDVLRAVSRRGETGGPATAEDVRHLVLLDRLGGELRREPWLRLPAVALLLAHDAEHGTDYAASLRAWLAAVGDVAKAAAVLTVHPNTLRYRLRRARELFGLDLDDPDVVLAAWLELALAAGEPDPSGRVGRTPRVPRRE
ncbi:helix-turn-helix domain-containing protein [Streptomyces sp. NPDC049597]|uniref:PucR family transcriptional regulator n=1 Tax=Streptomyces sp. NPDC049597 TaxID=3155276 RepID=UPI003414159A